MCTRLLCGCVRTCLFACVCMCLGSDDGRLSYIPLSTVVGHHDVTSYVMVSMFFCALNLKHRAQARAHLCVSLCAYLPICLCMSVHMGLFLYMCLSSCPCLWMKKRGFFRQQSTCRAGREGKKIRYVFCPTPLPCSLLLLPFPHLRAHHSRGTT